MGAWLLGAALAAEPVEPLIRELLDAARDDVLEVAWIQDHVDPGPQGWSELAERTWSRAFEPGAPVRALLQRAQGIAHVAHADAYTRVVLDSLPLLSVVLREVPSADGSTSLRITSFEPTTCVSCDERTRFVKDLVADVRRRGVLAPRLTPGLDLEVSTWVELHPDLAERRWTAILESYLHADGRVADLVGGAVVYGLEDDRVRLRYPDGRVDQWRVVWRDDLGWRIAYEALDAESPLRLDDDEVPAWRRVEEARATRLATWRPTGELTPDGAGRRIGEAAVGAAPTTLDDTVVMAAIALDRSVSAVFRVDPASGEVLDRIPLPVEDDRHTMRPVEGWATRWPFSVRPDGTHAAVAMPLGVFEVDLVARVATRVRTPRLPVTAMAWTPEHTLALAMSDGTIEIGTTTLHVDTVGKPLALHVGERGLSWVTDAGEVVRGEGDAPLQIRRVCDGTAAGADLRERDGRWLVACGAGATASHALVPWYDGEVELYGTEGQAGPVAAGWSEDGDRYAIARPEGGVWLWNALHQRREAGFGTQPLQDVVFSADGEYLLGLTPSGDVIWWHVNTARRLHGVVRRLGREAS